MNIQGVQLNWQMMVAALAAAQFALIALAALIAPVKLRKALGASAFVLAIGFGIAFDAKSLLGSKADATQASMTGGGMKHEGSCAMVANDMTANEVKSKLGTPDEVRTDDKVRGPGSTTLIYKDLRCAVHLFDEKVELID